VGDHPCYQLSARSSHRKVFTDFLHDKFGRVHNTLQHRQNGFQSLRGKYINKVSSSEIYALNKQDEINQE